MRENTIQAVKQRKVRKKIKMEELSMQFTPYISRFYHYFLRISRLSLIICFAVILLFSGCSNTPESNSRTDADDFKSLGEKIIDLVTFPIKNSEESTNNSTGTEASNTLSSRAAKPLINTKNAYLEQEKSLMSGVSEDVVKTYQQALILMKQKKWSAAINLFDQVITKQEYLSGAYINKALILKQLSTQVGREQRTEQLNESERLIDKAISVNPLNPYAHYFKGQFLQNKGQFEQAEESYAEALHIWPNYTKAQLSMAVLLELYRGKLLEAYQFYSVYLAIENNDKQVIRWQAALAIKIKRAGLTLPVREGE
jgi:tetratricopeptide (TPR) repeat protein